MAKGYASWHTVKEALGWNWGATSKTLQMKEKRVRKALDLLDEIQGCKRVSEKRWQQVVGVLRSLQPGMAGSEGHFSLLQEALVKKVDCRVRLTPEVHEQLEIFRDFLHGHAKRPTTLEELVPGVDLHIGACDAAKNGRGGVWFTDEGDAIVWREPYNEKVRKEVISEKNLNGKLTNSDLELEGTFLHHFVLGKTAKVEGETTYTGCDNTPAVAWRTKGSSTSKKARARILRLAAGLRREQRAHHRIGHLSGVDNRMADDVSRLWHLSDPEFVAYFNKNYPQTNSWQLYRLPNTVNSLMTSVMLNAASNVESVLQELQKQTLSGPTGAVFAPALEPTQDCRRTTTPWSSSSCLEPDGARERLPPVRNRSGVERRKMPCARWARPFPHWDCSIQG